MRIVGLSLLTGVACRDMPRVGEEGESLFAARRDSLRLSGYARQERRPYVCLNKES